MMYYCVILALLTMPMVFACIGYIKKVDVTKLVLPLCMIIFGFFMSFRAKTVGADTCQYVWGFEQISDTPWNKLYSVKIYGIGGGGMN